MSNIFEEAGKWFGEKKKKKVKPAHIPKQETIAPPPATPALPDEEVGSIFKRIREMDQDLQKRIQRICQLSGMSKEELESYIEDPKNFRADQWKKMQEEKEEYEAKIVTGLGMEAKTRSQGIKKKKLDKDRKGKMLGARKKWLQM